MGLNERKPDFVECAPQSADHPMHLPGPISAFVLAHWIRISDILPWDRKSYLTHVILPRLSREGYTHWLYWNSCTWSSSDITAMLKVTSSCEIVSKHIQGYLEAYSKIKKKQ